jgi:small-conductance mechanosensitive channel
MDKMEQIKQWVLEYPIIWGLIKFFGLIILILLVIQYLRKQLKKNISNSAIRYKSQKSLEIIGYIILFVLLITYLTGTIKDFTIVLGLFTAGLAFSMQELILSIIGSIYIILVKVYQPGDRIEINGVKGDVLDIDIIYTTLMEVGEWVESDNYSGRIVKLSNAFVFKVPIYNYSQDFPFIWDEFNLPVRYGSDIELAKSIFINIASKTLSDYTKASKAQWEAVVTKYYIEDAQVEPTLALKLTDNWIQFNIRYIVDYKKRRSTKYVLNDSIRKEIEETNGKVVLASTTLEIIKIPEQKTNKIKQKTE